MIKYILILLALTINASAQHAALQKGDRYTIAGFKNVYNVPEKILTAEALKGKIIIIDFWNTHCTSCVYALPKMDYLQDKFKKDVQIVIVTRNSGEEIESFIRKSPYVNQARMLLPIVSYKKDLDILFPHRTAPHVVIIGKDGIVRAITGGIDEDMLDKLTRNISVKIAEKDDFSGASAFKTAKAFNPTLPPDLTRFTLFSAYQEGFSGHLFEKPDSVRKMVLFEYVNVPLFKLFAKTYPSSEDNHYVSSAIVNNTHFSDSLFTSPLLYDDNSYDAKTLFCYSRNFPLSIPDSLRRLMVRRDMEEFFQIKTRIERRTATQFNLIKQRETAPHSGLRASGEYAIMTLGTLMDRLQMANITTFFEDKTGLTAVKLVKVHKKNFKDIDLLNNDLQPFGVQFVKGKKEISALVFEDLQVSR